MASAAGLPRAPHLHLDLAQARRAGAAQFADEGRAAVRDTASLGRDRREPAPAGGCCIAQFLRKRLAPLPLVGPHCAPDRREDRARAALTESPQRPEFFRVSTDRVASRFLRRAWRSHCDLVSLRGTPASLARASRRSVTGRAMYVLLRRKARHSRRPRRSLRATARREPQLGMITLSMAWMTPFLAWMSLVVTLAPFTVMASPLRPSVNSLPETVFTLSPSRIKPTSCAETVPGSTWKRSTPFNFSVSASRESTVVLGSLANAASVGANTVYGPAPFRVEIRSAVVRAAVNVLKFPKSAAAWMRSLIMNVSSGMEASPVEESSSDPARRSPTAN